MEYSYAVCGTVNQVQHMFPVLTPKIPGAAGQRRCFRDDIPGIACPG